MAETALRNTPDVKEFMKILRENNLKKQYGEFSTLINYVGSMENQLKEAFAELNEVQQQLEKLKDSRHPLKNAMIKTINNLKNTLKIIKEKYNEIKTAITEGAKKAVAAFKEKGLSALNSIMKFFHIKDGFNAIRENADNSVKTAGNTIAKIDKISREIHAAGSHRRNIIRVIKGQNKQNDVKANGKTVKIVQSPFRAVKGIMAKIRDTAKDAVKKLEQLDRAVQKNKDKKPSVLKPVKEFKPPERNADIDKSKKLETAIE